MQFVSIFVVKTLLLQFLMPNLRLIGSIVECTKVEAPACCGCRETTQDSKLCSRILSHGFSKGFNSKRGS